MTFVLDTNEYDLFFNSSEQVIDFTHATQPFLERGFGIQKKEYFAAHERQLAALRKRLAPNNLCSLCTQLSLQFNDYCRSHIDTTSRKSIQLKALLQKASFYCTVNILFGQRAANDPNLFELFHCFDDWFEMASSDIPHLFLPKFKAAQKKILSILERSAADYHHDQDEPQHEQFVGSMIAGDRPPSSAAHWLLAILWAAEANTMVALFWFILSLIEHPEYLEKCRDQISQIAGDQRHFSYEQVKQMTLLDHAMKETIRLHATPIIVRATRQTVKIGKYQVPPGHFLCLSPLLSHQKSALFGEDAMQWKPERWENKANWQRFAILSFGSGKYRCPGQNFAYMQLTLIAAILISNYQFQLTGPIPKRSMDNLVGIQKPKCDAEVIIQQR
eukprot:CAMPEP_0201554620 /NCGR_PEP_ID=MMETSP0173_2-20130828/42684_1 /ASSEMBLY_ACC=CAM_ASM_000268 /TAXON_ID=218659 /ORGANISM="Vexillifera sp., Strain DIVA3 564/2" /LENGTH=387 /DNA_ID=CAMNT_0047965985 /DNA_START=209 /DNA_END=1372 /DNA_ORIENTATION=+